ncbi:MAG: hypothetical protein V1766_14150 [Pseudomonadota bacterium]
MKPDSSGMLKLYRPDLIHAGSAALILYFFILLFMLLSASGCGGGGSSNQESSTAMPIVTRHPADQAVAAGQTASFTVAASGNPAPTFQWERSADGLVWTDIQGAAGTTYSFTAEPADNGARFRVRAINREGAATSNAAMLTCPPRTFLIGSTTRTFAGSPGSAGSIPVRIYYPAKSIGADAPVADGRFPLVVFSHGYQQAPLDYRYVWECLVPAGYIVALTDKLSSTATIAIDAYAADINFVLAELYRLASGGDAVLGLHLETTSVLLGHSTGGGASVIAAANAASNGSRRATTLAILAPLGQTYGPITGTAPYIVAGGAVLPTLILTGGKDCICPPASHARLIYNNLHTGYVKYLVTVTDGDHCGFSDASGPGKILCESTESASCLFLQGQTIDPARQNALTVQLLRPWLDRFLKGDTNAWTTFRERAADERLFVESSGEP